MTGKAGNAGSFVPARGRVGSLAGVVVALLIIAGLLLYVGSKVKIVRLGYQIDALEREKRELERENRSLLIEASSLTAPSRIEEIAVTRLGMTRPANENIVIVRRRGPTGNSRDGIPGRR